MIKRSCILLLLCLAFPGMALAQSIPADGLYTIGVSSSSRMFRIVRCVLDVTDGTMTVVFTLGGDGYGYVYPGSAQQAASASKEDWIPCVEDWDGASTYALALNALDQEISVAGYSKRYQKWYDRTLTFFSDTIAPYDHIAPDGIYTGVLISDTQLNGASCQLEVREGQMNLSVGTEIISMPLSSLDKRLPLQLSDAVAGWIRLPAHSLSPLCISAADGVYQASVKTDSALLRFSDCILRINDGKMTAVLKCANRGFDHFYPGSAMEAPSCEDSWITGIPSSDGGCTYVMEISSLDHPIPIATHSAKKNMWYDRTLIISSDSLIKEGE